MIKSSRARGKYLVCFPHWPLLSPKEGGKILRNVGFWVWKNSNKSILIERIFLLSLGCLPSEDLNFWIKYFIYQKGQTPMSGLLLKIRVQFPIVEYNSGYVIKIMHNISDSVKDNLNRWFFFFFLITWNKIQNLARKPIRFHYLKHRELVKRCFRLRFKFSFCLY